MTFAIEFRMLCQQLAQQCGACARQACDSDEMRAHVFAILLRLMASALHLVQPSDRMEG